MNLWAFLVDISSNRRVMSLIITFIDSGRFGGLLRSEYECFMETYFPGYYFEYIRDVGELDGLNNLGYLENSILVGFGKIGFDILRYIGEHTVAKTILFLPQTGYKDKVFSSLYDKCDLTRYLRFQTNYYIFMRDGLKENRKREFMNVHFYDFDGSLQRMKRNGKLLTSFRDILP